MKYLAPIAIAFSMVVLCQAAETLTDSRDGHKYAVVEIGGTKWMAENLDFAAKGSFCYDDDAFNCERYGRLYTWDAAQNVCPEGWRLASMSDWNALTVADFQKKLKVHPSGFRNSKGKYELEGLRADFWSDSESAKDKGDYTYFSFKAQKKDNSNYSKKGAMSVRCVEGEACDWNQMEGREFYEPRIERKDFSVWQNALHHICGVEAINDFYIIHKKSFRLKCSCNQVDDPYLDDGGGYPEFCGSSGENCNVCEVNSVNAIKQCLPGLNIKVNPSSGFLTE
jgi:hypothetical protein